NDRVIKRQALGPGDRVLMGHVSFVLQAPGASMDAPGGVSGDRDTTGTWALAAQFLLRVDRGDPRDVGQVFPLTTQVMVEGRRLLLGGPGRRQNDVPLCDDS